jgi:hypothetical protein
MAQFAAEFPDWEGLTVSMPRRPVSAAAAAVAVALAASGCSHGARATDDPSASPTTASPTPSRTPDKAAIAKQGMIAAYRATFTDVQVAVAQQNANSAVLGRHAIGGARNILILEARSFLQDGVVPKGVPRTIVTVSSLNLANNPAFGQLRSCVDPSTVQTLDKRTGKPARGWVTRPQTVSVRMIFSQGRWVMGSIWSKTGTCR